MKQTLFNIIVVVGMLVSIVSIGYSLHSIHHSEKCSDHEKYTSIRTQLVGSRCFEVHGDKKILVKKFAGSYQDAYYLKKLRK